MGFLLLRHNHLHWPMYRRPSIDVHIFHPVEVGPFLANLVFVNPVIDRAERRAGRHVGGDQLLVKLDPGILLVARFRTIQIEA